jgi:3'-5' exoribonuclease
MNSHNLNFANLKHGGPFTGRFRVRSPLWRWTSKGQPFVDMLLEDMNGSIPAYIWRTRHDFVLPGDLSCVQVGGLIRMRGDRRAVADVEHVASTSKPAEDVIRLIPRSICPLPWLMPFLEVIVSRIQAPWLRQFVMDVFSDDSIAFPFVACPASLRYHHNYPGGLLRHSIECAQMVSRYQEFTPEKKEIGIVAALLHDVGKILTMTPKMRRTTLGSTLDHDKLTLEILSPYLRRVDSVCPQGAAEMRYLLTWRPGYRDSGIPKTPLANAVLAADRVSAGVNS